MQITSELAATEKAIVLSTSAILQLQVEQPLVAVLLVLCGEEIAGVLSLPISVLIVSGADW